MRNRMLICVFVFALCFIILCFASPVSADGGDEILTVNAAWLDGEMLRINVTDANGVSSTFALRLTDYVSDTENSEYISIQAVDLAGNKSGVIQVKNPYYVPPDESNNTIEIELIPSETESPPQSESVIPDGSKLGGDFRPFTPDGTGTVMDNVADGDGKEFFTVSTEDGSVFYLIVDRQRSTDNVYLLNAVTEDDLMALAQKNNKTAKNEGVSAIPTVQPETTTEQLPTATATTEPESTPLSKKSSFNISTIIFIIVVVAVVGGVGFYFKIIKGKKNAPADDEYDMEFEDDEEESDNADDDNSEPENEGEDDV